MVASALSPQAVDATSGNYPVGSGPFEFVSQEQDKDVVLTRSPRSWQPLPSVQSLRFAVVPDATTRTLELQKGSADAVINALPADMVYAMRRDRNCPD